MRYGIFGWLVLAGCTTAAAPAAPTGPAPSSSAPLPACNDSSQCAPDALCCPTVKTGAPTSFGASSAENVCATSPAQECGGHELCGGAPCRSPWPSDRPPPSPARTHVDECHDSRHCPKDTTCALLYFEAFSVSSVCVYNVKGEPHPAHVAPACATDADCKAALPLWKSLMDGERYAKALADVRCVDLKNDIERRRGCVVPGNAPFP